MTNRLLVTVAINIFFMALLLYPQADEVNYIIIKSPAQIPTPTPKETKKQEKQKENKNTNNDVTLIEVEEEGKKCLEYKVVDAFKCKDCFRFILKEHKSLHSLTHKLESVSIGVRYKCSKCGKVFMGEYSTFCPKCKGRLNNEVIEIEQVQKDSETYLVDKKSNKKICHTKSNKKEDSKKNE